MQVKYFFIYPPYKPFKLIIGIFNTLQLKFLNTIKLAKIIVKDPIQLIGHWGNKKKHLKKDI